MKKILSFVLVLAMVLGSVSMAFAATEATFPDVEGTESYAEAANVLKAVGVLEGYNDGKFKADRNITRAEAVKLVVVAMGLPVKEGNSYKTIFEDVPENAWYSGYVYWATTLGITQGTTPTTFRPDREVTYDEMITFAMRALGYNDNLPGGYPAGYVYKAYTLAKAADKDTYDHVPTGSAPATRGACAEIIYAIMDQYFVQYSKDLNDFQVRGLDNEEEQTPFERLGCVIEDAALIDDEAVADAEMVDISKALGSEAHLITKDGVVVGVGKVVTTFLTGDDGEKIGGKKVAADALDEAVMIINGEKDTTKPVELDEKETAIYAVKFDSKGVISEVVSKQVWTPTKAGQMDDDLIDALNFGDKNESGEFKLLDQEFKLDDDDQIINSSFILEGAKSLGDIAADNIVVVYVGPKSDKITKVTVSDKVITGKLTAVNSAKGTYTIDGTSYKLSDALDVDYAGTDIDEFKHDLTMLRGSEVNAYFDAAGKIYFAESSEEEAKTSTAYAVLLAVDAPNTTGTSKSRNAGEMEVFNADGEQEYIGFDKAATNDATVQAIAAGTLVKITKNSSGKATKVEEVAETLTEVKISKKGVVDAAEKKAALPTDAVVFSWNGKEARNYKNYSIIAANKLFNTTDLKFETIINKGNLVAVLLEGDVSTEDESIVVFTGWNYGDGDTLWDVKGYEDGASKTWIYTASASDEKFPYEVVGKTSAAPVFYILEFDSNDYITKANTTRSNGDAIYKKVDDEIVLTTSKTTVSSNNVLKVGEKNYELADNIVVYTWTPSGKDDGKGTWTVSTSNTKLAGLTLNNTDSITLMSEGNDFVFEAAVVIKSK